MITLRQRQEQVKQVIMSLRLPEARADRHGSVFMQTVQNSREELTDSKTSFLITWRSLRWNQAKLIQQNWKQN